MKYCFLHLGDEVCDPRMVVVSLKDASLKKGEWNSDELRHSNKLRHFFFMQLIHFAQLKSKWFYIYVKNHNSIITKNRQEKSYNIFHKYTELPKMSKVVHQNQTKWGEKIGFKRIKNDETLQQLWNENEIFRSHLPKRLV